MMPTPASKAEAFIPVGMEQSEENIPAWLVKGLRQRDRDLKKRLAEQINDRIHRRLWAEGKESHLQATMVKAKRDAVAFINDWVWTYDPRNADRGLPAKVPLILRPRQIELIEFLDRRQGTQTNGLIEKSRDEGMTWVLCAYAVHKWLFVPGWKLGVGSRKLTLVDDLGNMDAIFPKIRYILRNLPGWMLPAGYNWKDHDNYCRIINPDTGASITGEGGDEIGRGGRNTMYFVDEHPKLAHPELVERALSQNTNCIIYGGTPNGPGNLFAQKRFGGKTAVFTMHWTSNPDKNYTYVPKTGPFKGKEIYPWYELQKLKYDDVTLAQEVDIDYNAATEDAIIPAAWVRAAVEYAIPPASVGSSGLDVADTGANKWVYIHRKGGKVTRVESWPGKNQIASTNKAIRYAQEDMADALFFDRVAAGGVAGILEIRENLGFDPIPILGGDSPTRIKYSDDPRKTAKERFYNLRAELWWNLRLRFFKSWQNVNGHARHPLEDCISIPNDPELIAQLSTPRMEPTESGKIRVESKKAMRSRGIASPDKADALVYAFAHKRPRRKKIIKGGIHVQHA